jgi:hypothetical protein
MEFHPLPRMATADYYEPGSTSQGNVSEGGATGKSAEHTAPFICYPFITERSQAMPFNLWQPISRRLILALLMLAGAMLACSLPPLPASPSPLPPPTAEPATAVGPMPTEAETSPNGDEPGMATFEDESFGLSFEYPAGWNGPEVNRYDGGIGIEVGTDTVYPYGTGLDERNYTVENAYFVSVTYTQNINGWTWQEFVDSQPWIESYTTLIEMEDGEEITTPRSLTIRVGEVQVGPFSGVEYISTLSETAQTEIFYAREVLLFDNNVNYLRITGSPNNVVIGEGEDWRTAYQGVDADYQQVFHQIVASISVAGAE